MQARRAAALKHTSLLAIPAPIPPAMPKGALYARLHGLEWAVVTAAR